MKPSNCNLNQLSPEHQHMKPITIHSHLTVSHHHQFLYHTNPIFHILVNFNI